MGAWGAGVWDNDAAADFKAELEGLDDRPLEDRLLNELRSAMECEIFIEDMDTLIAAAELLRELYKRTGRKPPEDFDRAALHQQLLELYDNEIDELDPDPDYKEARREVIEQTLAGLEAV